MADAKRKRIVHLIRKTTANHEYFFDNLEDPGWLRVLADEGFFKQPIEPERGDGWIRYPFWSESRYLARTAAKAPNDVFEIATRIGPTENARVHEDLLRISAQLPGKMAAKLVRREAGWLRDHDGHLMSLPEAAGEALAHLAEEQELDVAYEFARALLAIRRPASTTGVRRQAVARFHEYAYGRIIERAWPALVKADAGRAFRFLCDRLADVIRLGFTHQPDSYDSTSSWRSAIEDHGQNLGHSLLDLLVDVVRDQALGLARTSKGLELVLTELQKRPEPLFQRLALHVIQGRGSRDLVMSILTRPGVAFDAELWHEYGELLRQRFADLDDQQQGRVLSVLDAGERFELTPRLKERGVTAADVERWDRHARFKRYAVVAGQLPDHARAIYDELREEFGEPAHPTFLSYSTSWTGPTSPLDENELRAMDPSEVVQELRKWTPQGGPEDPSPEGLGRVLKGVIAERADAFAAAAADFKGAETTYVRALVDGLSVAVKDHREITWPPVLDLCAWVAEQPRGEETAEDDHQSDPHWGWARKAVAGLLSRGFAEGTSQFPLEVRGSVWSLLTALAEDPDPTPEREARSGSDDLDPATLSINTTRGEALHAVVRYMLWVERTLADGRFEGAQSIPEVVALLDRHLNPQTDPSRAVRSVYGQWFPQFARIDKDWAARLAPRVFPLATHEAALFAAAWDAYIVFNRPYTDVLPLLRDAYATAIERLNAGIGARSLAGDPRKRLGEHLVTFRIRGEMPGGDDLFLTFWAEAESDLRKEVLTSTGWSLGKVESLQSDVASRLRATWERIFAGEPDDPALAGFGAWLETRALAGDWLLQQALAVLGRGIHLEPDFVVYEALSRLTPYHPGMAIDVLRRMISTESEDWSVHGSRAEVRQAIDAALTADDSATQQRAREVVDLLAARGMTTFRELLQSKH